MAKTKNAAIKEALKLKECKYEVRREGSVVKCGRKYLTPDCPDAAVHLHKMRTGFCFNGWCEGTKAVDWRGRPVPTCTHFTTCPCKCHTDLDRLFHMTGQERILVESSGYMPPVRDYWMPEDDLESPDAVLSMSDGPEPPTTDESPVAVPVAVPVPPPVTRTFVPTPTGKTPKGQLEAWVQAACDVWIIEKPGFPCTPTWVANEIAHTEGITPPSVGAIDAVFKRWIKLGFAIIEKQPTRFMDYTEEGKTLGLERMKERSKRQSKLKKADDQRNLRRM